MTTQTPRDDSDTISRLLASLADTEEELPSPETAYWRAKARLAIGKAGRRRLQTLRPLRVFNIALGGSAIVAACLTVTVQLFVPVPEGAQALVAPLLITMFAVGALFLAEALST